MWFISSFCSAVCLWLTCVFSSCLLSSFSSGLLVTPRCSCESLPCLALPRLAPPRCVHRDNNKQWNETLMFLIGFSSGPRFEIIDHSLLYNSKHKSKVKKAQWYAQLLILHKNLTSRAILNAQWLVRFYFCIYSFMSEGTRRPMSPTLFVIK